MERKLEKAGEPLDHNTSQTLYDKEKHPRLPRILREIWQSCPGVLKPKLAIRGVPCLPGVGLTLYFCHAPSLAGEHSLCAKAAAGALGQSRSLYL